MTIGPDCRIGAHASLSHALLGARVFIYPGARIGQEGFSFATTKAGFLSIPQLGRVIVEDDVEVGANTTIDRGSTRDTIIGAGSRLDNLVQIGHNVRLGRCCVIVAQVGIAGSTILEDFVQVGGQAAMAGHLRIGQGAQIGAQAGVISDVSAGAVLLGSPAQPRMEFFRQVAALKRMVQNANELSDDWQSGDRAHGTHRTAPSVLSNNHNKQRIASVVDDPARMLLASCTCLPEMNS